MNPILIAGLGYTGTALAESLIAAGKKVAGLSRSVSDQTLSGLRSYPVSSCDLGDREAVFSLAPALENPPSHLIHCASSSRGGIDAYRAVFVDGTRNLIDAFPGVPLIFTSSTSVYGQNDGTIVTESSPTEPDRETGRLLRQAEDQVLDSGGTVLRLAGLYGPGRSVHVQKFLDGTAVIESGPVSRLLNQIHRDDAVGAILHVLNLPAGTVRGQIFNVADDTPITQRECYEILAAHFGRPLPPEAPPDPDRKRGLTSKAVSNEKLRATGWRPRFSSFAAALREDAELAGSNFPIG